MVRKYLSYKDDDEEGTIVKGYFEVLEETANFIKFKTNSGQTITLPYQRFLKIKEKKE